LSADEVSTNKGMNLQSVIARKEVK